MLPHPSAAWLAGALHQVCSPSQYNTRHQRAISHTPSHNSVTDTQVLLGHFFAPNNYSINAQWRGHTILKMQEIYST